MRDKRFVAVHRGGPLTKDNHRGLIRWAMQCSEHILPLLDGKIDKRLMQALHIAGEWENGRVPTGDAMRASQHAHAAARESPNQVSIAVARSIGHAVATAHMADHSLGAALYGLKAVNRAGKSINEEREWQRQQLDQLPPDIVELVKTNMVVKEKSFKL